MKAAPAPHKSRFSPVTLAIGVVALAGLLVAAGYALALATRPAPPVAPVAVVPVAEKVEPKPVAKKVEVVAVAKKRVWAFDEALDEAKAMAERMKDEDFEEAKKNLTPKEMESIFYPHHFLKEGKYNELTSHVNSEAYYVATSIGMGNFFNKRIARWSFKDKYFPHYARHAWSKVAFYRMPEAILHSAILYGYDDARMESVAEIPVKGYPPPNQTVKRFWESFGGCRWSDLSN